MSEHDPLFEPITVGTMALDHRVVLPPHSGGRGSLLGPDRRFERFVAYWLERAQSGIQWIGGAPCFVRNPLIPGFEPTGIGASGPGTFRHPQFVERLAEYSRRLHDVGAYSTVQLVLQGGMPLAPSQRLSGYHDHDVPHAMTRDEITWLVREYGESAALAADGGADVVELHANHDDVLQWFLSPLTNHRDDEYGGDLDGRRRLLREVVESIREHVDRPLTLGLRLTMDEMIDGGYGPDECRRLLTAFTADGTIDYVSLDVGNNWGAPSYVAPSVYGTAPWAELCGRVRDATDLPVLYAGRVTDLAAARDVLTAGHADLVGIVRALIAEPRLVANARLGHDPVADRPCIGLQDCIGRRVAEHLPFACGVNPHVGHEAAGALPAATRPRSLLVVGGGPAGMETAALAAERGHAVRLIEQQERLGGQLAVAARARMNRSYADLITWQERRLERLGVAVELGVMADVDLVQSYDPEVVVVATGAVPRLPDASGLDRPWVVTAAAALTGASLGRRVLVVSEDDRPAPLAVADHLAGLGHAVTLLHRAPAPSPLVHKYWLGSVLARLDREGVRLVPTTRLVAVDDDGVEVANCYSGRRWRFEGLDTVVLATGSISVHSLADELRTTRAEVHLVGDAYAPRRVTFATTQARALVASLD